MNPLLLRSTFSWMIAIAGIAGMAGMAGVSGEDWPCFRGPDALGVSSETGLPEQWSAPAPSAAAGAGSDGQPEKPRHIAWTLELADWGNSSPSVAAGRVYITSQEDDETFWVAAIDAERGKLILEQRSGKVLWKERLEGDFKASPIAGDGKVYFINMDGQCTVLAAGPEKKVLSVNPVDGSVIATPAISNRTLFIRAQKRLYAVRQAAPAADPPSPAVPKEQPARKPAEKQNPPAAAAPPDAAAEPPLRTGEAIFPPETLHNHGSCIVQCPNGDLLACWYRGSGERKADDVVILGARHKAGQEAWSAPFPMADTPGFPDCNSCMLIDSRGKLWLFWPVVLSNEWQSALTQYKVSSDYQGDGPPRWEEEKVLYLKPGDEFDRGVEEALRELREKEAELRPRFPVDRWIQELERMSRDKLAKRLGWMPRAHPTLIAAGRIIVPLYSDGFNFSLMAYTDDWGANWKTSAPLVGGGNVQPSVVERRDGSLAAYMRDNGLPPKRLLFSESKDRGATWSRVSDTEIPNPGSGVEAIRTRGGAWLLINNDTERGRHSLAVSLSEDEGKTWPWTAHLEPQPDLDGDRSASYPSILEAQDGSFHASYSRKNARGSTIYHARFNLAWIKKQDR